MNKDSAISLGLDLEYYKKIHSLYNETETSAILKNLCVPLASAESNPRKINVGNVKVEPPPALTFIKPAISPTPNRISKAR